MLSGQPGGASRIRLRIVPTDLVRPHEIADPGRERRIETRLTQDGVLRDPVIVGVVPDLDGYVLLDGTNRQRALIALGFPSIMVQVLEYADDHAVQLRTWSHAAPLPLGELVERAAAIAGIEIVPLAPLAPAEVLRESSTLAVLLDSRERFALFRTGRREGSRAEQLRRLVANYEDRMVRVDCDPDVVEERAHTIAKRSAEPVTLVAFPGFSRSAVVSMAMEGSLIPAGITRHVILVGRALRVNLPLDILALDNWEASKSAFAEHLSKRQPRLYTEPTLLFDS